MTYYYILSSDPDPRNFSCKKFIIDEDCNWICGNGEGSDAWDELKANMGGYEETCKYLIEHCNTSEAPNHSYEKDGCLIRTITEKDVNDFEEAWK